MVVVMVCVARFFFVMVYLLRFVMIGGEVGVDCIVVLGLLWVSCLYGCLMILQYRCFVGCCLNGYCCALVGCVFVD